MNHEMTIGGTLFDRVVQILEQARSNVVQVTAYWLIGREIVVEIQCGKERAVYGKQVIENPIPHQPGRELGEQPKSYPPGSQFPSGFSPQLSWSHYRALMRVSRPVAREFYLLYCYDVRVQLLVAQIGWTYNLMIFQCCIMQYIASKR